MYARPVTLYIINPLYINAMRRFMFTCAGTPLALPYQEFTKGMNPLAPPVRKGGMVCLEQGVFEEVIP